MIRVDSITIKEFRGIRDLTLNFEGRNFAICGPNGTGKSGVVDALEFALTGNVSRLSGEGSGDISLKQHGPHVDRRNDPDQARVTVKATIPTLSKTITVERSLKNPAVARVTPSDPTVLAPAPVEFRGDAQYRLGELLPEAVVRMKDLYRRAKAAASSWNQKDRVEQIQSRESQFALLVETSKVEQWQVNAAVHFNSWDNLVKEDFHPVVKAFQELIGGFTCLECCEYLRVSPDRETPESIRCECDKIHDNLRRKCS